jgi:hypothetical protein
MHSSGTLRSPGGDSSPGKKTNRVRQIGHSPACLLRRVDWQVALYRAGRLRMLRVASLWGLRKKGGNPVAARRSFPPRQTQHTLFHCTRNRQRSANLDRSLRLLD